MKMFKRPALNDQEMALEDRKKRIQAFIRDCESRGESVKILIDSSKQKDALILLKYYQMDLLRLAGLIYEVSAPETLEEVLSFLQQLPDHKIVSLFLSMKHWQDKTDGMDTGRALRKRTYDGEQASNQIFGALKKAYTKKRREKMQTPLDRYKRHRRYAVILCLMVLMGGSGILWGNAYLQEKKRWEGTRAQLAELADLAFEAKKKNNKSLVAITGSTCSACACKKGQSLKGISDKDPCVRAWRNAIKRICQAANRGDDCIQRFRADAWGSPFALDENEREYGKDDTREDVLRSAGPDGVFGNKTKDDLVVKVRNAFSRQP